MNNVRNNVKKDFTVIPNALVNDNEMTPQARFLFVYMASKPDDWRFYQRALAKDMGWSLDTLRKYQGELMEKGWMSREQNRKELEKFDGFDYTLHGSGCRNFSDTVKIRSGKNPQRENSALTNNINTEQKNTLTLSQSAREEFESGSEKRIAESLDKLTDYFRANPARWDELCNEARVKMTKEEFWGNIKKWVRWNADNYQVFQNPVKALTSGRNNFLSWLGNNRIKQASAPHRIAEPIPAADPSRFVKRPKHATHE